MSLQKWNKAIANYDKYEIAFSFFISAPSLIIQIDITSTTHQRTTSFMCLQLTNDPILRNTHTRPLRTFQALSGSAWLTPDRNKTSVGLSSIHKHLATIDTSIGRALVFEYVTKSSIPTNTEGEVTTSQKHSHPGVGKKP